MFLFFGTATGEHEINDDRLCGRSAVGIQTDSDSVVFLAGLFRLEFPVSITALGIERKILSGTEQPFCQVAALQMRIHEGCLLHIHEICVGVSGLCCHHYVSFKFFPLVCLDFERDLVA